MDNKPASPFDKLNRLDTKLIRSTRRDSPPPPDPQHAASQTPPSADRIAPPHKPLEHNLVPDSRDRQSGDTSARTAERPNGQTATRPDGETAERPNGRQMIRHGFDIFADQIDLLRDIQRAREKRFKHKVTLGQLAQEALDSFIEQETTKNSG